MAERRGGNSTREEMGNIYSMFSARNKLSMLEGKREDASLV